MPGQCRVCGSAHAACGPAMTGVPVTTTDVTTRKPYTMADLKEYSIVVSGIATTALLNEDDAARLGAVPIETPAAPLVVDAKSRPEVRNAARPLPPNKAR